MCVIYNLNKFLRRRKRLLQGAQDTGVGCHFLLQCVKVKLLGHVRLLATPWTPAYKAPPPMGFSRQECWSGYHCLL